MTTHLEGFPTKTRGRNLSHRKLEYVACSERTGGAKRPRRQGAEPWKESLSNFLELFDKEKNFCFIYVRWEVRQAWETLLR